MSSLLKHVPGMSGGGVRNVFTSQHTSNFLQALPLIKPGNICERAALMRHLANGEVMVAKTGDLREMRDAQHLMIACDFL